MNLNYLNDLFKFRDYRKKWTMQNTERIPYIGNLFLQTPGKGF